MKNIFSKSNFHNHKIIAFQVQISKALIDEWGIYTR